MARRTLYSTYHYGNKSKMFHRRSIVTMRLDVWTDRSGKKHYKWTRVRTAVVVRDPQTMEVLWKYSINGALGIHAGDNMDYQQ